MLNVHFTLEDEEAGRAKKVKDADGMTWRELMMGCVAKRELTDKG